MVDRRPELAAVEAGASELLERMSMALESHGTPKASPYSPLADHSAPDDSVPQAQVFSPHDHIELDPVLQDEIEATEAALFEARQVEVLNADVQMLEQKVADEAATMASHEEECEHLKHELAGLQREKHEDAGL